MEIYCYHLKILEKSQVVVRVADKVTAFGQWDDEQNGVFLSDHTPIWADVEMGK